jgi:putative oxidoreductase
MTGIQNYLPFVGRVLIALVFLWSGLGKIMDPAGTIGYISSANLPLPQFGYALALAAELGGGVLLVIGLKARIVAAVLALFTFAAALAFHNNFSDLNQAIHFMKNISIVGGLLQVVAFGGGALSFDTRMQKA